MPVVCFLKKNSWRFYFLCKEEIIKTERKISTWHYLNNNVELLCCVCFPLSLIVYSHQLTRQGEINCLGFY
jgi:hypothetical protein